MRKLECFKQAHALNTAMPHKHDASQQRREEGRYEKERKRTADLGAENERLKAETKKLAAETKKLAEEVEKAEIRIRYHEKRYQELKASSWQKQLQGTQEVKLLKDQLKELQEQYTSQSKRLMAVRASASSDCQHLQQRVAELANMVDSKSNTIKNLVETNTNELRKKDQEIQSKDNKILHLKNLIWHLEKDLQNYKNDKKEKKHKKDKKEKKQKEEQAGHTQGNQ